LLKRRTLKWDGEWLGGLPLAEEQLSPLVDVDQPLHGLQSDWAARWPVLKNIPWFPAIGDGAAANVGSDCSGPERLALTIGTTGAMRVVLSNPPETIPPGLWLYRLNREYALLGGATAEGGNVFAWLSNTLQLPPNVEDELAQLPPAAHGLTVLPFIAGERAPGWRDGARAVISGLTRDTRPIDILQAGLEGVAYRFALLYRSLTSYLLAEHHVIASGSALLSSPAWMQMMADVLGRPLAALGEKEATSRGVALLALRALGQQPPPADVGPLYRPNSQHHAVYQAALAEQVNLYRQLLVDGRR
jgi:gluconokinase